MAAAGKIEDEGMADGTPSSVESTPEAEVLAGASQEQPMQPVKRKGGRKPIYATSEERKQRNRQAQAAFRERRTEYIKQLEATIKQNEDSLATLQQSHRTAADECLMLRYKNSLLERILLEKGIDVQAELQMKTGSPILGPGFMPPEQEYDTQEPQSMLDHTDPQDVEHASNTSPTLQGTYPPQFEPQRHHSQQEYYQQQYGGNALPQQMAPPQQPFGEAQRQQQAMPTSQPQARHSISGPFAMGQVIDPNDPMLDADPFGLSASMHYPTAYSAVEHRPHGSQIASKNLYDLLGNDPELDPDREPEPPTKAVDKPVQRPGKRNAGAEGPGSDAPRASGAGGRGGREQGNTRADLGMWDTFARCLGVTREARLARVTTVLSNVTTDCARTVTLTASEDHVSTATLTAGHARLVEDAEGAVEEAGASTVALGLPATTNTGPGEWADEKAGEAIAEAETKEEPGFTPDTAAADPAFSNGPEGITKEEDVAPAEPEDNTKSYDQYLADLAEKRLALGGSTLETRKANEGSKQKFPEGKAFSRNPESENFIAAASGKAKKQKEVREKDTLVLEGQYYAPVEQPGGRGGGRGGRGGGFRGDRGGDRGGRGGGGFRGDRGDREGRGGGGFRGDRGDREGRGGRGRGGFRGDRGGERGGYGDRAERGSQRGGGGGGAINVTDDSAFPSLGGA
ncbi:hypothetical protein B0A55_01963 [Friedmanniomyces simplex]|uniref:BZIP domain-containing protein n=1 Tax=Friedmanniomyces simplex TaxID=329884 RepID=A0A4U0XN46_9PEZI|nr:hypothetical protein B0A55_01963 [Friedmanniomyces simplex]